MSCDKTEREMQRQQQMLRAWLTPRPQAHDDDARPCRFETFSGECLVCGAGLGEPCEGQS